MYLKNLSNSISIYELDPIQSAHISKVLRLKEGNYIELFDGDGAYCEAEITSSSKRAVEIKIASEIKRIEKNKHSITSIIPYLKKDNLLFMAEKLTELGVNHLVFYKPNNIDQSLAKKDLTKLNKKILEVVIGGCKQSGINFLPQLEYYDSLSDVFMNSLTFKENSFACTFDLQAANKLTPDDLNTRGNYVFITGPESGFSNDERFVMVDKKISSRSLGVNTLRAETAPIIGATLFQSFLGNI